MIDPNLIQKIETSGYFWSVGKTQLNKNKYRACVWKFKSGFNGKVISIHFEKSIGKALINCCKQLKLI